VVQLRYFFGSAALIEQTSGLTYAGYARQGFFQLVTASALVLPILLGADHLVRGAAPAQVRVFRQLAGLLLGLLAVIMHRRCSGCACTSRRTGCRRIDSTRRPSWSC